MGGPTTPEELLGLNIAALRKAGGATQREVAEAMSDLGFDWNRETVTQIERGRRRVSLGELATLAAYFDLPINALVALPQPGTATVTVGGQVLPMQHWVNLWETWNWQKGPAEAPAEDPAEGWKRAAIEQLFDKSSRPWARIWRRLKGHPAASFAEAREEMLRKRERFPGPIYVTTGDTPLHEAAVCPPWGTAVNFELEPGVPYVARDELEAERLDAIEQETGLVKRIPRHTAHYMRQKRRGN